MDGPDQSEQILPPHTGEYDLIHLMQYPNGRVRALAGLLRTTFGWTTRDTFSGEYITYLCNYVERAADGRGEWTDGRGALEMKENRS